MEMRMWQYSVADLLNDADGPLAGRLVTVRTELFATRHDWVNGSPALSSDAWRGTVTWVDLGGNALTVAGYAYGVEKEFSLYVRRDVADGYWVLSARLT